MNDITIYKELLEREEFECVSLLAKVAYSIYVSMLDNRDINVKTDNCGVRYINDGRSVIAEILHISPATITKIHKELEDADLIEEKHQGVSQPLATYIKNYETIELENTHETEEMKEIGEVFNTIEFSDFDIQDAKKLIDDCMGRFPYITVSRILEGIDMECYSEEDQKMIKYSIVFMDLYYFEEEEDYERIIEYIDEEILYNVLEKNRKIHTADIKATIIAKEIFELAKEKYQNDNN